MKRDDRVEGSSRDGRQHDGGQRHVNRHFDAAAPYWDAVYSDDDIQGLIYRQRQAAVLHCVRAADLNPGDSVLEIGCGAGHLTIELAGLGLRVDAVDASAAMAELTDQRMREADLRRKVHVRVADAHALPFQSGGYRLVVAVGVIPWLHSPHVAVAEMARVLCAGGRLVLTADNRLRLTAFTDPRGVVALTPLRRIYRARRAQAGVTISMRHSPRAIDRLLLEGGMRPIGGKTVGFGPLTLFGRPVFNGERGVLVGRRLQALAERDVPLLRQAGWHYVVVAEKSPRPG